MTWDALNHLEVISGPGLSATFEYDALGRRISKTINGVTTGFLYDGNDIVAELGGGAVSATYVRSLNIDEPFVRQSATGNEYFHPNALGSVLVLTNDAGAVTTSYSYEAFGKTTITGTTSNPFQYTGRENDGTGLYYYRTRYYHPTLARFTREDPIGLFGQDVNFYAYVYNNPTNFVDPTGKWGLAGGIVGGVSGAVGGGITGFASGGVSGAITGGLAGAVAGGTVGFINPWASHGVGAVAGNIVASALGRIAGNIANSQKIFSNFSVLAALGAGYGSTVGLATRATQIAAGQARVAAGVQVTSGEITTGIMVTPWAQRAASIAEGVVDGAFSGIGELGGSRIPDLLTNVLNHRQE